MPKYIYRPYEVWGKVMFLQVSVILFTGGRRICLGRGVCLHGGGGSPFLFSINYKVLYSLINLVNNFRVDEGIWNIFCSQTCFAEK